MDACSAGIIVIGGSVDEVSLSSEEGEDRVIASVSNEINDCVGVIGNIPDPDPSIIGDISNFPWNFPVELTPNNVNFIPNFSILFSQNGISPALFYSDAGEVMLEAEVFDFGNTI
ncbi:hypothetical protein [Microbulbifer epialgicus]|uniref:Uncharacterized protein n=1 Tax=Microbulbifer epialgicus TaxID=393907 RepID=A0ABV4P0K7_9GAMM